MDNTQLVYVGDSLQNAFHYFRCLFVFYTILSFYPLSYELWKLDAIYIFHSHVKSLIKLNEMFNFYNIRMVQLSQQFCLLLSVPYLLLQRIFGFQDLNSDNFFGRQESRSVDLIKTSLAQQLKKLVDLIDVIIHKLIRNIWIMVDEVQVVKETQVAAVQSMLAEVAVELLSRHVGRISLEAIHRRLESTVNTMRFVFPIEIFHRYYNKYDR